MYTLNYGYYKWEDVFSTVLRLSKHVDLKVESWQVPVIPEYFEERIGDNDGQVSDFGVKIDDGRSIHVKVYESYYKIHWDQKDPNTNPLGHLVYDAPHWLLIALIVTIGVYTLTKSR